MLKVIVELWPGGCESGRRVLATADILRMRSGSLADYEVRLQDDVIGEVGRGILREYPRYASTVWDLVVRGIAVTLARAEHLPVRPQLLSVTVRSSGSVPYVRIRDIPEPAQTLFRRNLRFSTAPLIEDDPDPRDCAYAWDWHDFLAGRR